MHHYGAMDEPLAPVTKKFQSRHHETRMLNIYVVKDRSPYSELLIGWKLFGKSLKTRLFRRKSADCTVLKRPDVRETHHFGAALP